MKMVEHASYPTRRTIPQLETSAEAEAKLRELAEAHGWVSVFWDRGWGDSGQPLEITIIVNGNGQQPEAVIDREIYRDLLDRQVIRPNSLRTFKARRVHDYCNPDDPRWRRRSTADGCADEVT